MSEKKVERVINYDYTCVNVVYLNLVYLYKLYTRVSFSCKHDKRNIYTLARHKTAILSEDIHMIRYISITLFCKMSDKTSIL